MESIDPQNVAHLILDTNEIINKQENSEGKEAMLKVVKAIVYLLQESEMHKIRGQFATSHTQFKIGAWQLSRHIEVLKRDFPHKNWGQIEKLFDQLVEACFEENFNRPSFLGLARVSKLSDAERDARFSKAS